MADETTPSPNEISDESAQKLPEFSEKIETALREGGRQIRFDDIEKRYRGKRVWVLDREKMQQGVMRVVDEAILKSQQQAEGGVKTRQRVAAAIATLFGNSRNITSPVDPNQVRQRPATPTSPTPSGPTDSSLDEQITRLSKVIDRAEGVVTTITSAAGRIGFEGRGWNRRSPSVQRSGEHNRVLAEIFKTNLELRKGMKATASESQATTSGN